MGWSQESWGDVSLQEVVARQLQPYAANRVRMSGPRVLLKPNAALAFGLVIHEFATNAMKYGALANPQGQLDISWTAEIAEKSVLRFEWRETTPSFVSEPKRKGFGTDLIERELKHILQATTQFQFEPHGLRVSIAIPMLPDRLRIPTQGEAS